MPTVNTDKYQRIFAKIIIPGKGNPIYNGVVILKNDTIDYVGTLQDYQSIPNDKQTISRDISVHVLMPGLWDCHTHFMGQTKEIMSQYRTFLDCITMEPTELAVVRSAKLARDALNCGYTSVRECGGYGIYLNTLIDEGIIPGPHIYSAGKVLSITGGHGDSHNFPLNFVCCPHAGSGGKWSHIVDGVDKCLFAVRNNIRNGAKLIKIMSSGGIATIRDAIDVAQFNNDEIQCIVKECKKNNIIVAAHAHGREGIEIAIDNGVYSIEHGTFLDDALAKKMVQNGCVLVPTRYIMEYIARDGSKLSKQGRVKIKSAINAHRESIKCAIRNNVTICSGSDLIFDEWGNNTLELKYYVDAGMTELEAIQTATANGPLSLGNPQINKNIPKTGQIKKGYVADLISIVNGKNPLSDITVLADPRNIPIVWKSGVVVKNMSNAKL